MNATLQELIDAELREHAVHELALGFLRYEQMRMMSQHDFESVWERFVAGASWDNMIDAMLVENAKEQP